jgi:ribonuclease P protein component
VRRTGKRVRLAVGAPDLEARVVASARSHPRVGFIVPRYKHTAVDRNRLKRRLRELVRRRLLAELAELPAVDLVIRAKPCAYDCSFVSLAAQIETLRDAVRRVQ